MKDITIAINEALFFISYKKEMEKSLGFPVVYNIETTNHCAMDCIMCPRSLMKRPVEHMRMELFRVIIDQAKNFTEFIWLDHFGDPLLNPELFDMIAYAKAKELRVCFSTNATSVTPEKSRRLIESKLDLLHISLDGVDQETYSYYRGKNANYDLAVRNIEEHIHQKLDLQSSIPYTTIAMIKMDKTAPQVNKFIDLWSKKGVDKVFIKEFSTMDGTIEKRLYAQKSSSSKISLPKCYFPWSSVTILVDGRVVPCCYDFDGKVVLGDLTKESLASIWNGKQMRRLRQEHILGDYSKNSLCRNCTDRRLAKGVDFIKQRLKSAARKTIKPKSSEDVDSSEVAIWYA